MSSIEKHSFGWHSFGWIGTLIIGVCIASSVAANSSSSNGAPTVETDNGTVAGIDTGSVHQFRGIPYAAPPVGNLRWKPPRPARPWTGVHDASAFADYCAQPAGESSPRSTTEDCLYLNVYTPENYGSHRVMVWIHGGNFVVGDGNFDMSPLAKRGVVVVTINYRLGELGFLAHPALTAESPDHESGNYGIMDQQAALRWVQRNIARFGGDPDNVTLFGQSAGGTSVLTHLTSPTAKGLFHKAIVHSGGYQQSESSAAVRPVRQPTLAQAEAEGEIFAANAGCADQTIRCLRQLPVDTLLEFGNTGRRDRFVTPNTGTQIVPRSIAEALDTGQLTNRVPVIEGSTHDEHRFYVGLEFRGSIPADQYQTAIQETFQASPRQARIIAREYPLRNL